MGKLADCKTLLSPYECFCERFKYSGALFQTSIPLIVSSLIVEASTFITMLFVGRLNMEDGPLFIGAATLGNMLCAVTGYSLASGMCTALDTLVSQAFGAKSYYMMGIYCQRAIAILSFATILISIAWFQTEYILTNALRIDPKISQLAGLWAKILTLGLWPGLISEILGKFLICQQIVWPVLFSSAVGTIANAIATHVLVTSFDMGYSGCALGFVISKWASLISLVFATILRKYNIRNKQIAHMYEIVHIDEEEKVEDISPTTPSPSPLSTTTTSICDPLDPEDNWPAPSIEIFREWIPFMTLGVPGALSLFIEWGSFELAAGIVGQLGTVPLAAHGIFASTCGLMYMAPQAIALSTATLAGNLLGSGCHIDARNVIHLGISLIFIMGLFWAILMYKLGTIWCQIYTTDAAVLSLMGTVMPIFSIYLLVDSSKCATTIILRSTGRPATTVWGNGFACLVVMLPLGYALTIKADMGLYGEWLAMSISWLIVTVAYFTILMRTDWKEQADIAIERSDSLKTSISSLDDGDIEIAEFEIDTTKENRENEEV